MIQLSYAGSIEHSNTKGLLFKAAFSGVYGVNGVGDLLNMAPAEFGSNPTGVLDPNVDYNLILNQTPSQVGLFSENLGGSYVQVAPNANPTLKNCALRVFAANGTELATGAAYSAAVLAGNVVLLVLVPLQ